MELSVKCENSYIKRNNNLFNMINTKTNDDDDNDNDDHK